MGGVGGGGSVQCFATFMIWRCSWVRSIAFSYAVVQIFTQSSNNSIIFTFHKFNKLNFQFHISKVFKVDITYLQQNVIDISRNISQVDVVYDSLFKSHADKGWQLTDKVKNFR